MTDATAATPPTGIPLVFVDDIDAPEITDGDRHHLERVLRVPRGGCICVADGTGLWRDARLDHELRVESEVRRAPVAPPPVTIAFALVKGARPELVVQKLTELGVDTIVPFVAEHSVVRWDDDRRGRHVERLRRVAREAAMQCRRATLPRVGTVETFATVAALPGAVAAQRHGVPPSLERPTLLIGPEGGWSDQEIEQVATLGSPVGLGEAVLRAETAAITGAALLTALRSRLVAPIRTARA